MNVPLSKRNQKSGQMLVETIIALTVLVVGLLGIVALLVRSLALSNFVSQEYVGTYLAAEGVEIVKGFLDHNVRSGVVPWNTNLRAGEYEVDYKASDAAGKAPYFSPGRPFIFDGGTGFYSYAVAGPIVTGPPTTGPPPPITGLPGGGISTPFRRKITILEPGGPVIKVKSLVWWTGPFGAQEIELEDNFYEP